MTVQDVEKSKRHRDPIVEAVREVRQRHAREFDYDPEAIFQDLKRYQNEKEYEVVSFPARRLANTRGGAA
jgi:hypothetical protein